MGSRRPARRLRPSTPRPWRRFSSSSPSSRRSRRCTPSTSTTRTGPTGPSPATSTPCRTTGGASSCSWWATSSRPARSSVSIGDLSGVVDIGVGDVAEQEETGPEIVSRGFLSAHPRAAYAARRIGLYLVTLWGSITASFFFFHLIPGHRIQAFLANLKQTIHTSNIQASQAVLAHYKTVFGLNGSLLTQYGHYMYQLFIKGTMGP